MKRIYQRHDYKSERSEGSSQLGRRSDELVTAVTA
ncbi:hypothetical protein C8D83_101298 [Halothiobacillus neapolitanus]|nr:hypothetical protein C8D83_101298 [Halothiobacillus neapolitanus]